MRWKTNLFSSGGIITTLNTHQQLTTSQFNCGKEKMSYKIGCGLLPDWTFQQKLAFSSNYLAASCLSAIKKMLFHMSLTRLMINPIDFFLQHIVLLYLFSDSITHSYVGLFNDYSPHKDKAKNNCLPAPDEVSSQHSLPQDFHFSLL